MITPSQGYKFCIRLESELRPRQGSPERVFPKAPAPHIVCGAVPFSEKEHGNESRIDPSAFFWENKNGISPDEIPFFLHPIISGWNLSWGEGCRGAHTPCQAIISGWNLSWGEGRDHIGHTRSEIISGWNLSWGEGRDHIGHTRSEIISGWNLSWGEGGSSRRCR